MSIRWSSEVHRQAHINENEMGELRHCFANKILPGASATSRQCSSAHVIRLWPGISLPPVRFARWRPDQLKFLHCTNLAVLSVRPRVYLVNTRFLNRFGIGDSIFVSAQLNQRCLLHYLQSVYQIIVWPNSKRKLPLSPLMLSFCASKDCRLKSRRCLKAFRVYVGERARFQRLCNT